MAFKELHVRSMEVDENGKTLNFVVGTHETGDTLPTEGIYQGSYSINLDDKSVVFFNGDTESWG